MKKFHLSVVATSRNDDHGVNLLYRMQNFVDGFVKQCKRHNLNAELILVEWNPIERKESLAQVLKFPQDLGPCAIRIIRVPKQLHDKFANSDKIPLYQMIAKNVGIRRALGEFVLATNIDILFSDELIQYLRDELKKGVLYRVDRLDIPHFLPETDSFDEILSHCKNSFFRINGRFGTRIKINGKWKKERKIIGKINIFKKIKKLGFKTYYTNTLRNYSELFRKIYIRILFCVHTNACGDFTLLSNEDWERLRAYAEWPIFSWHIDSMFVFQARITGIKQMILPIEKSIYHIEHSKGSGYTPGDADLLFKRLKDNNIPYIEDRDTQELIKQMMKKKKNREELIYNDEKWGLADFDLEEIRI